MAIVKRRCSSICFVLGSIFSIDRTLVGFVYTVLCWSDCIISSYLGIDRDQSSLDQETPMIDIK
jgi:hypothetical protein